MLSRRICIACILAAALAACNRDPKEPSLPAADQGLVNELLAEYKAELLALAAREPGRPAIVRAPELEARLGKLGLDPARGARILSALHDSLTQFRETLLRASSPTAAAPE